MTELQLLLDQANTYFLFMWVSLISGFIIFAIMLFSSNSDKSHLVWIPFMIGVILCFFFLYQWMVVSDKVDELKNFLFEESKNHITLMSCGDLRNSIISQLKSGNQTMLEFQQDWYYANCETPLKPLVEKLK